MRESAAEQSVPGVRRQTVTLATEDARTLAVTVYAPEAACDACALVIFSHGNFATPERYDRVLRAWAAQGFVVAAPLHTDSEEYPAPDKYPDSRATRLADWRAVDTAFALRLPQNLDLGATTLSGKVIAAGHSYGALIALVAGGATLADPAWTLGTARAPEAVIALSPPGEMKGLATREGLGALTRPALVVTGTTDVLPGFIDDWHQHLDAYEAAPQGLGYALVFAGMNHYFNGAFGRPSEDGARESADALARMTRETGDFMRGALGGTLPVARAWAQRSDAVAEARAH
ncbi:alpha/beta hydrolase family protein [Novosphingobium sp. MBES04]|uniref:alpha/beta hydrolase family protein n=1 Tax=Novosphingobium sp. MBES04 TaxID=1206458 RepID=UPI00118603A8|nr:hypothetical protein [Novosphingobium sp. MBES04]